MNVNSGYFFVLLLLKYVRGKCGPGTFPSQFISGGNGSLPSHEDCLGCPQNWTYCKGEVAEDIKPCESHCGELNIHNEVRHYINV